MSQTSSASPSSAPSPVSAPRPMGPGGSLLVFLLAGLLAGGASLGTVVLLKDFHKIPEELASRRHETDKAVAEIAAAEAVAARKNLFLTAAVLGAVVAGLMGVAGGVRDRSLRRGIVGLLLGLALGGGLGFASAYLGPEVVGQRIGAGLPREASFESRQDAEMFRTLGVHATLWGLIGVAAALAATGPTRRIGQMLKSVAGALVVAILAMAIYQALLGNFFQVSRFELLLPQDLGPIVAWTLPANVLIGIALGRLSVSKHNKS